MIRHLGIHRQLEHCNLLLIGISNINLFKASLGHSLHQNLKVFAYISSCLISLHWLTREKRTTTKSYRNCVHIFSQPNLCKNPFMLPLSNLIVWQQLCWQWPPTSALSTKAVLNKLCRLWTLLMLLTTNDILFNGHTAQREHLDMCSRKSYTYLHTTTHGACTNNTLEM